MVREEGKETTGLKAYEEEVLERMYDEEIIGPGGYKSVQIVRSKIGWQEIARKHRVRKKFPRVARHLRSKGFVSDYGKSGDVVSLTQDGVNYVRAIILQRRSKKEEAEATHEKTK